MNITMWIQHTRSTVQFVLHTNSTTYVTFKIPREVYAYGARVFAHFSNALRIEISRSIRLSEKFLSFHKIIDEQEFLFYIISLN